MPDLVYKAGERTGVTTFEPRPFWETNNFARSGSAADPSKVPAGARLFHGVYATREPFVPFYFAPRHCPRFSIDPWANEPALLVLERRLGPLPRDARRVIVFREGDRAALAAHAFSVYALDAAAFTKLPTGEFLADAAVEPVSEARHHNATAAIEAAGWAVRFVEDVEALRRLRSEIEDAGVTRFSAEKI